MGTTGIKEFDERVLMVTIEGRKPGLLTNAIPPHVIEALKAKGEGRTLPPVAPRTLAEQFDEALYWINDPVGDLKFGIKPVAFKLSMVRAAKNFKKLGATSTKKLDGIQVQSLVFVGDGPDDLVPVVGTPEPRTDLVGNATGGKSAATRAWFREWMAVVPVRFAPELVHEEKVLQLLSDAGQGVGVGAWRRETGGYFGLWKIVSWD